MLRTNRLAACGFALLTLALFIGCPPQVGDDATPPIDNPPADAQAEADAEEPGADAGTDSEEPTADGEVPSDEEPSHSTKHTNRLAKETSPYLLLHAHNPVDWYPWGEEAFAKATEEDKPIFLSIGYSSCYWCHVMERESFMDEEIAALLNEHFVCIKVDREERPDVDQIYMKALHLTGQRGGWPLSMFLSPGGKPLFSQKYGMLGGTYWPARDNDRGRSIGFLTVAESVREAWSESKEELLQGADLVAKAVRQELRGQSEAEEIALDDKMITGVWEDLQDEYDPKWGGFGYSPTNPRVPKFPEPSNLMFLIDRVRRKDVENWEEAREILTHTLDKMSQGGIYDHLGGGFHRYSVDRYWHIPHFEKMLYDNGQLASVYAEAYEVTGNEEYRFVVEGILDFVQREMTDKSGGFYAALDAETDAEEGKFYRWEKEQLDKLLGEKDRALFGEIYNLNGEPNFKDEHGDGEYYVPMLSKSLNEHAKEREMTLDELLEKLKPTRERLFAVRSSRERPLTDTKVLTSWNGLMIRGFADAGRILKSPHYIEVAEAAAEFLWISSRKDYRLMRTNTDGVATLNAYLDDYAFYIDGLIAIDRAGGSLATKSRQMAASLQSKQNELFWDEEGGGYFFTSSDHEQLIARTKDPIDTVIPSGNSVSAGNLLHLSYQSKDESKATTLRMLAAQTMQASGLYLRASPSAVPRMAIHVAEYLELEDALPAPSDAKPLTGEAETEQP